MKLLAIKIVANNFFGFSKSLVIMSNCLSFVLESLSRSVFDSEKKAISVPEINAEDTSKKNSPSV